MNLHTHAAWIAISTFAAGLVFAAPAEDGLIGYWPLRADAQDLGKHHMHGVSHDVEFKFENLQGKRKAALFDGRGAYIEVPDHPALHLGTGDFTMALRVRTDAVLDDVLGDVLTKFDSSARRGFNLAINQNMGACGTVANTRNLFFGIDQGTSAKWESCGRVGEATLVYALAVHDGALYAGTFESAVDRSGHVYRFKGGTEWEDLGAPDKANSVTSLASYKGSLYAAVSRYNAGGSHLAASPNLADGGKVYRFENGKWMDCGKIGPTEFVFGLAVYKDQLYASLMDSPNDENKPDQGLYRYDGGNKWSYCGNPGGRVASLAVWNGYLWGTGYDGGDIGGAFRYDGGRQWTNFGSPPGVTQTYSFAFTEGKMNVGTWPDGTVFINQGPGKWEPAGRLGSEKEVMGMAVYNGMLYGGTLPLAQVYRRDGPTSWTLTGRLDMTPDVEYRRAWCMAIYDGQLYCGTLPAGQVHAYRAGATLSYDKPLEPGWRDVAVARSGGALNLFVDGKQVAKLNSGNAALDIDSTSSLKIGAGPGDYFYGSLCDLRIYNRALSMQEIEELRAEADAKP